MSTATKSKRLIGDIRALGRSEPALEWFAMHQYARGLERRLPLLLRRRGSEGTDSGVIWIVTEECAILHASPFQFIPERSRRCRLTTKHSCVSARKLGECGR